MRQHDEVDSRRVRRSVATELSEDLAFLSIAIREQYLSLGVFKRKSPVSFLTGLRLKTAATYFPTWYRSIIGASELNFSVRNGMRWILTAITALFVHRRIFTPSCGISYEKDNAVRTFFTAALHS